MNKLLKGMEINRNVALITKGVSHNALTKYTFMYHRYII